MTSVPDFSQAPAAAAVELVTPPGSDPLTATTTAVPVADDDAERAGSGTDEDEQAPPSRP